MPQHPRQDPRSLDHQPTLQQHHRERSDAQKKPSAVFFATNSPPCSVSQSRRISPELVTFTAPKALKFKADNLFPMRPHKTKTIFPPYLHTSSRYGLPTTLPVLPLMSTRSVLGWTLLSPTPLGRTTAQALSRSSAPSPSRSGRRRGRDRFVRGMWWCRVHRMRPVKYRINLSPILWEYVHMIYFLTYPAVAP